MSNDRANDQPSTNEPAPEFYGYWDEDECFGATIEEYVRGRNPDFGIIDEGLVIGDEFTVSASFARSETWKVVSGPTLENPKARIVCERVSFPQDAEGREAIISAGYHTAMAAIARIAALNPAADSTEGKLLIGLVDAVEAYEKVKYPEWTARK